MANDLVTLPETRSLKLRLEGAVAWLSIDRPAQANALDAGFWSELPQLAQWIDGQPGIRAVVLHGAGRHFCAGIDLAMLDHLMALAGEGEPAQREQLRVEILRLQDAISALEILRVPVIAAIAGACVGGGVDLSAACDIRLAAADARFCIKEVDFGIVADVGTTQRLRHVIGLPALMQLSLTAETFDAARALQLGLVSAVHPDREALMAAAAQLAAVIAAKPPIAARGVKQSVLYAREHSVADGLEQAAAWNASMGFAAETRAALASFRQSRGTR
jgi:enoyl-CoA hydratase